jgi:hypothetical protein
MSMSAFSKRASLHRVTASHGIRQRYEASRVLEQGKANSGGRAGEKEIDQIERRDRKRLIFLLRDPRQG